MAFPLLPEGLGGVRERVNFATRSPMIMVAMRVLARGHSGLIEVFATRNPAG